VKRASTIAKRCDFWDCRTWFKSVPYVNWKLGHMAVHCSLSCESEANQLRREAGTL